MARIFDKFSIFDSLISVKTSNNFKGEKMVEQIVGDEWAEEIMFQNESAVLINNMIAKWQDEDPDDCYVRECMHISFAILLGRLKLDSEQKELVRLHFSGCHFTCPETGAVTDECGRTII